VCRFELVRSEIAERAVSAVAIVEVVDVVGHNKGQATRGTGDRDPPRAGCDHDTRILAVVAVADGAHGADKPKPPDRRAVGLAQNKDGPYNSNNCSADPDKSSVNGQRPGDVYKPRSALLPFLVLAAQPMSMVSQCNHDLG
jgi:hypothetical protein